MRTVMALSWFWSEPRRRRSKKQRLREKHKRTYRKGKEYEKRLSLSLKEKPRSAFFHPAFILKV